MKILEERLTRLEASLSQRAAGGGGGGFTPPGGVISDPAPWGGGGGGWQFFPRPSPVVDPAPWQFPFQWGRPRWPNPIADPGPFPTPVVDPAPWPNPIADPATFAQSAASAAALGRIRPVGGDPPPPDISRLSVAQLEATLHNIAAEKARLDSMENLIQRQIETAKKQAQPQKPG